MLILLVSDLSLASLTFCSPHCSVYFGSMAWFAIWSLAGGFAPNEIALDIFRAFQGVGMSAAIVSSGTKSLSDTASDSLLRSCLRLALQPAALGILGTSFAPGQTKTWAFAAFSAGAPLGGGIGGVLGGV